MDLDPILSQHIAVKGWVLLLVFGFLLLLILWPSQTGVKETKEAIEKHDAVGAGCAGVTVLETIFLLVVVVAAFAKIVGQ